MPIPMNKFEKPLLTVLVELAAEVKLSLNKNNNKKAILLINKRLLFKVLRGEIC